MSESKFCALLLSASMAASMIPAVQVLAAEEPEVFKLTVHSNPAQGDWNEYWLIRTIEEKFNVDIQVEMVSNDIWRDKLPLMFASDELPDFFLNSLDASDIATYGEEEYLLDLSQYISEEKTPNIWEQYRKPQNRLTSKSFHEHEWITYKRNIYPDILEGLRLAVEKGYLETGDCSKYRITSMNFGWEMPGAYNGSLYIRKLTLTADSNNGEQVGEHE